MSFIHWGIQTYKHGRRPVQNYLQDPISPSEICHCWSDWWMTNCFCGKQTDPQWGLDCKWIYKMAEKKKKIPGTLIKLDFQKAYDSVNWIFLKQVMEKLGFGRKWVKWIMNCVTSASLSILLNGSPLKPFKMEKGPQTRRPPFSLSLYPCQWSPSVFSEEGRPFESDSVAPHWERKSKPQTPSVCRRHYYFCSQEPKGHYELLQNP